MFVARRAGQAVATSLIAIDPAQRAAWGRYWGCLEPISCLHFEACYYQPLSWCLELGYRRFEGGAQGEHKMNRGLLPVGTTSAQLRDPRFQQRGEPGRGQAWRNTWTSCANAAPSNAPDVRRGLDQALAPAM
jgi:predicted N-acyltransferase